MVKRLGASAIEEEEIDGEVLAWSALRDAKNRKRVLVAKAIGLEELELLGSKMECLKLNYQGIYGYLPRNKIDNYEFRGVHNFLGKSFEFIIEELIIEKGEKTGIFVANRIEALKISANIFWNTARVGQIYESFIRGIDPYHLYLLVEGVEVKLHRSEVDYSLYDDLRQVYNIGESIDVKILNFEKPENGSLEGKLEVSARILNKDPWENITNYKERMFYVGKLVRIHPTIGMFLELEPGLSMLANFPAGARGIQFKPGDEFEVKIGSIDVIARRIFGVMIIRSKKIGANNPNFRNSGNSGNSGLRSRGASRG
ncbi:S1 RNA-binding domain-containing protein [Paenibacillus periandrae]|uniref:S1 RNA-binding domain-containing protein n=1 Tax=Paenibacillus periandrae TaxID=1761741 RepID=UPI001F09FED3|nr:S1 RNA-binding domain-containing protein [Paenibacillus periandrae]